MPPRKLPLGSLILLGLMVSVGIGIAFLFRQSSTSGAVTVQGEVPIESSAEAKAISREYGYEQHFVEGAMAMPLQRSIAHVVTQPADTTLSIAVAADLSTVEDFAKQTDANYIINGGFFDPNNGKTTSHLVAQGQIIGDPESNERLIENPALSQYMPQILNRSEFRVYCCPETDALVHDITFRDALPPNGCELKTAIGAGPQLLPDDTSLTEAFVDYDDGAVIRDAVGSLQPNARSAIGLYPEGAIALIMVEKGPNSTGLTFSELADFAASLGITKLLNLDGGSSSSLFVASDVVTRDGATSSQTYFGRSDADGNPIRRAVKSVIFLKD
ncbi:MAG: phosphodiester glycosidase family protein [Cyanobacteria bacterium P01_D01_bin.1]